MAKYRGNCDTLWKLWYIFFVVSGYIFLTYNAVRQYQEFKRQAYDPRYGGTWIESPLDFYVAMKIVALAMLPIFLYSALLKVGNFANDGVMIGKDTDNLKMVLLENSRVPRNRGRAVWSRICQHFLPYTCYLHALSAFAFLLPLPTLHAEQIRNEARPRYRVWHSDLDFIFRPDIAHPAEDADGKPIYQESLAISPEMCNLMVALTILIIRLPNSFWFASRPFAILFSFKLLFASVHIVFNYCAVSVLYKLAWNPTTVPKKPFIHGFNSCPEDFQLTVPPWCCIFMEGIAFLIIIASQVIIYEYGHNQFLVNLKKYRQYFSSITGMEGPEDLGFDNNNHVCCYRFWTNIASLVLLIVLLCLKIPVICQFMHAYWCTQERLFLTATICSALYLCAWLLLWFALTVKTSWRFHVTIPSPTMGPLTGSGENGDHNSLAPPEKLQGGEPVYGCFHPNNALSQSSNSLENPRRAGSVECCSDSSKTSSGPQSQENIMGSNYVYLQSSRLQNSQLLQNSQHLLRSIPTISEHVDGTASDVSYDTTPIQTVINGAAIPPNAVHLKFSGRQGSLRGGPGCMPDDPYATLASVTSGNPQRLIMSTSCSGSREDFNSLCRNGRNRRSGSRVTFKEQHDTIPGSPTLSHQSSNVPSTDSGIGNCFLSHGQPIYQHPQQMQQQQLYHSKSPRPNYEDYQMFGNLFNPTNYSDVFNPHAPSSMANYVLVNSVSDAQQGGSHRNPSEYLKVPDILMTDQGMSSSPSFVDQFGRSLSGGMINLPAGVSDESEMAMLTSDINVNCSLSQTQDDIDQRMCSQV